MVRRVHVERARTTITQGRDGILYLRHPAPLPSYPTALTDRLVHWARMAPTRSFVVERDGHGAWQHLTYARTLERVERVAQALLARGLSAERPVVILSGNGTDHLVLALACVHVGIPYAPIAPAYALLPPQRAEKRAPGAPGLAREFDALRYVCDLMRPGLVFAAEAEPFDRAVAAVVPPGVELVASTGAFTDRGHTPFAELDATAATAEVGEAHARITSDTVAKILFTSGSTGRPKAVINTQRMLSSNQAMLLAMMPFLAEHPLVLCDWLPWNHTFGGNHNVGIVLYNGGTLYLDAGRPTPEGMATTLRNLRDVAPTAYFNVPRGYEMLMPYLKADAAFRAHFFSRVKLLFYAAAGLGQRFWDQLRDVAVDACGEEILMMTGLGATESAPYAISTGADGALSGLIGLPVPGVELKLAPAGAKLEARLRGPNVTPGFFRQPDLTAAAFDEEGFYKLGDAVRFIDPRDPAKGLLFDGRLNEDFKLATGTWVSVGPVRVRFLQHFAGLAQDVVVAAPDRAHVAALVFPAIDACRAVASGLAADASPTEVVTHPAVRARFQALLESFAGEQRGSAAVVARIVLLDSRPSFDHREITDKGSLNQKAVLAHRAALVEDLYADPPPPYVIVCDARSGLTL